MYLLQLYLRHTNWRLIVLCINHSIVYFIYSMHSWISCVYIGLYTGLLWASRHRIIRCTRHDKTCKKTWVISCFKILRSSGRLYQSTPMFQLTLYTYKLSNLMAHLLRILILKRVSRSVHERRKWFIMQFEPYSYSDQSGQNMAIIFTIYIISYISISD